MCVGMPRVCTLVLFIIVGGMLFADDFVSISDSKESLQKLIVVVYTCSYCSNGDYKLT